MVYLHLFLLSIQIMITWRTVQRYRESRRLVKHMHQAMDAIMQDYVERLEKNKDK